MPCNTITTVTLKLKSEIVRMDLLKETIEKVIGLPVSISASKSSIMWQTGSYNKSTGDLIERTKEHANAIRQTYAAELTKRTLGRAGWQVKTVAQGGR